MAITNADRVGQALRCLNASLTPFVERELKATYGDDWRDHVAGRVSATNTVHWDTPALLLTIWDQWYQVFHKVLGHAERSLVSELREWRNKWAHQDAFSTDDAYRALDSIDRLAKAIAAPESEDILAHKRELLRIHYDEYARKETSTTPAPDINLRPINRLKPPRDPIDKAPAGRATKVTGRDNGDEVTIPKREGLARINRSHGRTILTDRNTHFANRSSARPYWWLEIPIKKFAAGTDRPIHLLLYDGRDDVLHHLQVPAAYLRDNISDLVVRNDVDKVSLYLSVERDTLFQDVRAVGARVWLGQFLQS